MATNGVSGITAYVNLVQFMDVFVRFHCERFENVKDKQN